MSSTAWALTALGSVALVLAFFAALRAFIAWRIKKAFQAAALELMNNVTRARNQQRKGDAP